MASINKRDFEEMLSRFEALIAQRVREVGLKAFIDEVVLVVERILCQDDASWEGHDRMEAHVILRKIFESYSPTDELRITAMLSDSEPGSFLYRSTIEAVPRSSGGENCVTFLNQLYVACRLNAGRDLQSFLTFLIEQGMEAEVRTSWPSNLQRASPSTQLSSLIVRPLEFETSLTTLAYGSSLRDQIQAHTIQHGELTVLNIALAQKNETLEEKCFVLVAETESLQMTLDETRQNYALLEGDMALLLKANTQLRDEERNLNEQIAKLKTDLATTHSSLERANKEKTTSERKLILLHGRAQRAVSQRDAAVAQRATLQAQLERARNSCAKVSQELQETDGDDLFV